MSALLICIYSYYYYLSALFINRVVSEIYSEFERVICHFAVLSLGKLVSQCRNEFRIDLHTEGFYLFNRGFEIGKRIDSEFFDLLTPCILIFFQLFCGQNQRCSGDLRGPEFEETSIQQGNFLDILSEEENLRVLERWREPGVPLQESVGRGRSNLEIQSL